MKIKITNKLTKKQFSQALNIFIKFFPIKNKKTGINHFKFYLTNTLNKKNIIALDEESNLLGIFILLNRKTSFFGKVLKINHMSYLVVKDQKNFLVTKKIIDAAMNYVNKNSDLSVQILRKVMSHYWTRYGYIGFTNFNDFILNENNFDDVVNFKIEKLNKKNLIYAKNLYKKNNRDQIFSFIRDKSTWENYLKYINRNKFEASIIRSKDKVVAYTIVHNNILKEAVIEKGFEKSVMLFIINMRKKRNNVKNLLIQLSSGNSIIKSLRKYSHTENLRYVYEGGHTIRIHNVERFLIKIKSVIQNRLKQLSPIKFDLSINKYRFIWKNRKLVITSNLTKPDFFLNDENLTKLMIGVLDPEELFDANKKKIQFLKIMFPKNFPHLMYLDQLI